MMREECLACRSREKLVSCYAMANDNNGKRSCLLWKQKERVMKISAAIRSLKPEISLLDGKVHEMETSGGALIKIREVGEIMELVIGSVNDYSGLRKKSFARESFDETIDFLTALRIAKWGAR